MLKHQAHDSKIRSFCFDGQYTLYSGSDDFKIKAWDLHEDEIKHINTFGQIENIKSYHRDLVVLNKGDILVSTRGQFDEFKIRIWDVKNDYDNIGCLVGHKDFIRGMSSIGKSSVVTISDDKTLKLWKLK